jgi:hypothetical protein
MYHLEDPMDKHKCEDDCFETRISFETFKSNVCPEIKEKGDLDFIIETLQSDEVGKYWTQKWYPEAYYLLSAIDYLCRVNDLPICTNYEEIRGTSLKKTIYPKDIELIAELSRETDIKEQAKAESIPEFIRFNIVEKEFRDVC